MKTSNQEMRPLHAVATDDAIGMLIADHKRVAGLFATFKRLNDEGRDQEKVAVVKEICEELTLHTMLEEEVFYPAAREAIDDEDQMDEALVEHAGAKQLIAQLQKAGAGDDLYDAQVTVLAEQIDHHVEEEEGSMFPKARYAGLDTLKVGAAMRARRAQILNGTPGTEARGDIELDGTAESGRVEKAHHKPRLISSKAKPAKKKPAASKKRR